MENKTMEELKKEFDSFNIIHWQWIEQNFRSKQYCLRLIKETEEAHNKAAELKAENEKLKNEIQIESSLQYCKGRDSQKEINTEITEWIDSKLAKARKDERDKIINIVLSVRSDKGERLADYDDIWTPKTCDRILEKIEPNLSQNTENCLRNETSCEGCANNGQVLECYHCNYNNKYQPKEK